MKMIILILTIISTINCEVLNLTCTQIREFVDGHNERRLQLAQGIVHGHPPASLMKKMVWDEELAKKAAEWLSKQDTLDVYEHNPDRTIPSGRFDTNENLFWYSTTDSKYVIHPKIILDNWFDENKNYTFGPMNSEHFKVQNVGHYTQMVWSDTDHLGCAISKNSKNKWQKFLVVCNYGPQGNYLGSEPYATGRASGKLSCDKIGCKWPYGKKCQR
ncbi:venom allergen 5-like [Trichoplusia ni]|uniref:Venom allergen 5-like n=1 Tax=Trichoplusia ni TaxID=7111 RepID=A0A7E5X1G7_TRINI|nr:venom allergen 5-like [Trichoplusia ni]